MLEDHKISSMLFPSNVEEVLERSDIFLMRVGVILMKCNGFGAVDALQ